MHRSQSRPRPSPREALGSERFAGLIGTGRRLADGARLARRCPDTAAAAIARRRPAAPAATARAIGPGQTGGWRQSRGGTPARPARAVGSAGPGRPGERKTRWDVCPASGSPTSRGLDGRGSAPAPSRRCLARPSVHRRRDRRPWPARAAEGSAVGRPSRTSGHASSASASARRPGATRRPARSTPCASRRGHRPDQRGRARAPSRGPARTRPACVPGEARRARARGRRRVDGDEDDGFGRRAVRQADAGLAPDAARAAVRHQPQAARAGDPRPAAAGDHGPRHRRGRRRDDPPQRVPPKPPPIREAEERGAAGLRPEEQHDRPDAASA